jgi:hypothetical protein
MKIKIEPSHEPHPGGKRLVISVFKITVESWEPFPVSFKTYEGACEVANAISKHAYNPSGVVTIDYFECLPVEVREHLRKMQKEG